MGGAVQFYLRTHAAVSGHLGVEQVPWGSYSHARTPTGGRGRGGPAGGRQIWDGIQQLSTHIMWWQRGRAPGKAGPVQVAGAGLLGSSWSQGDLGWAIRSQRRGPEDPLQPVALPRYSW